MGIFCSSLKRHEEEEEVVEEEIPPDEWKEMIKIGWTQKNSKGWAFLPVDIQKIKELVKHPKIKDFIDWKGVSSTEHVCTTIENDDDDVTTTMLHCAIRNKRLDIAEVLLENGGANINMRAGRFGMTPLIFACNRDGHDETVKFLLEKGADITMKDDFGRTALVWASESGYHEIMKMLLAIIFMCDDDEDDAEDYEAPPPLEWVKILLYSSKLIIDDYDNNDEYETSDSDDDESEEEYSSEDEIWVAARGPKRWKDILNMGQIDIERIQQLLEDPKKKDFINWKGDILLYGRTMLMCSIVHERWDIVRLLLEHGADPNIADNDGMTPMHRALPSRSSKCTNDHLEIIKLLVEHGADPDIQDGGKKGTTSLHRACWKGTIEVVQLLLSLGANASTKTTQGGSTALQVASERNHVELVWFMVRQYPRLMDLEQQPLKESITMAC